MLVEGTKVVEQQMCAKKWNEIEYSQIPSVAINKYNKAWYRNDEERFKKYLEDVKAEIVQRWKHFVRNLQPLAGFRGKAQRTSCRSADRNHPESGITLLHS